MSAYLDYMCHNVPPTNENDAIFAFCLFIPIYTPLVLRAEEGPGKFLPMKDDLPGAGFPGHTINALGQISLCKINIYYISSYFYFIFSLAILYGC